MNNLKKLICVFVSIILLLSVTAGCQRAVNPNDILLMAEDYLADRDYDEALELFLEYIKLEPREPDGYIGAADCYIGLKQLDKAADILERGLNRTGDDRSVQRKLDRVLEMIEEAGVIAVDLPVDITIDASTVTQSINEIVNYSPDDTWAFYWYLCGSDLETNWALGTEDLEEMFAVDLPDNVTVVIEAGGARKWHNNFFDSRRINRAVYNSNGFEVIDQLPNADMGDPETLYNFLEFSVREYPADHQIVLFWNHGSGSIGGICYDENYGFNSLSVFDLENVFSRLNHKKFEMIGFDACLMATIDYAAALYDYTYWMVASQELEPGCGWDYEGLFREFVKNTGTHGGELGKIICDTFYDECKRLRLDNDITLSVINMRALPQLLNAYNDFGIEALVYSIESSSFFGDFGRAAQNAENYGGNNRAQGYTNMVDLGDLVRQIGTMQSSDSVLEALDNAVYYKVNGRYRRQSSGISCYYTYDGDWNNYAYYAKMTPSPAFKFFFEYELTGTPSKAMYDYLESATGQTFGTTAGTTGETFNMNADIRDLLLYPISYEPNPLNDWEVFATLDLGPALSQYLVDVYCSIIAFGDDDSDDFIIFGADSQMVYDWEKGIFKENMESVWASIDGAHLNMNVYDANDEYVIFVSPIYLNNEACFLYIAHARNTNNFEILGARPMTDEIGLSAREYWLLEPGDIVEPIFFTVSNIWELDDYDQYGFITFERITVKSNTKVERTTMPEDTYLIMFEMWDFQGNIWLSEMLAFFCMHYDWWGTYNPELYALDWDFTEYRQEYYAYYGIRG
ncbi:MAG: clostripain-related cysteine peptidase [Oscillospiraceae bacterium]|nr:clostripain-related cysteine peptidase [Oscillospiraceae bacterium]